MRVEVNPGYHVDTALRKKPFYPGEQFNLDDDKEGRRLVTAGVVTEIKGGKEEPPGGPGDNTPLNVPKTVELVQAAQTNEELDKLAEGEDRKGVKTAIELRRKELAAAQE